jgi:hypothetical protein
VGCQDGATQSSYYHVNIKEVDIKDVDILEINILEVNILEVNILEVNILEVNILWGRHRNELIYNTAPSWRKRTRPAWAQS